jgi:hypothetical protein
MEFTSADAAAAIGDAEAVEQMLAREAAMDAAALDKRAALDMAAAATVGGAAAAPAAQSCAIRVWVVRHSERADEQGAEVRMMRQRSAEKKCGRKIHRADPLLTASGLDQARVAGKLLRAKLDGRPVQLFTSPLLRCAQTAAVICEELQAGDEDIAVHPVSGLGSCALAIQNRGLPESIKRVYQPTRAISAVCGGRLRIAARDDALDATFVASMDRIARGALEKSVASGAGAKAVSSSSSLPIRDIVCVTHREAFYGPFFQRTGGILPYKPPYCCIGEFTYDGRDWGLVQFDVGYSLPTEPELRSNNNNKAGLSKFRRIPRRRVSERVGDSDVMAARAAVYPPLPPQSAEDAELSDSSDDGEVLVSL